MNTNPNIQLASHDTCTGCAACVSVCPKGCITMREDREGFLQPHIDAETCIGCHKCEKTCPIVSPITIPTDFETQAYAAINKDEDVRMRSSSGGMFHALAKWTIEQGGVVFGARFDDKWEVMHDYAETIEGIEPFMRSKYVQSRIGETYKQAKEFLKAGRQVLFVGTPCQIGGLHTYLGKDYENLIMVDFICHGVPSPAVWRQYLKEKAHGDKILDVNYREKMDGWMNFNCIIQTERTTYRENYIDNVYFKGFLLNDYLRKSCYNCQYKNYHRIADITIADFWGIKEEKPELYDNKGISFVLFHTPKGKCLFQSIETLKIWDVKDGHDVAKSHNRSALISVPMSYRRTMFFSLNNIVGVCRSEKLLNGKSIVSRTLRKIFKIADKIL